VIGVKAENLVGISTGSNSVIFSGAPNPPTPAPVTLNYQFEIFIPLATWKDTLTKLDAVAKNLPAGVSNLQYNSRLSASAKVIEQGRQTVLPDLLAEARKNADALALAAGFKVGAIQGLSETHFSSGNQVTITISVRFAKI